MASMSDFARVILAFIIVYVVLPVAAGRRKGADESLFHTTVRVFLLTSAFFVCTVSGLGRLRLALPPIIILTYVVWLLGLSLTSGRLTLHRSGDLQPAFRLRLASFAAKIRLMILSVPHVRLFDLIRLSPLPGYLVLLLFAATCQRAAFALGNLHFPAVDGYSRAMSLHLLNAGELWQPNVSVT